ncbi:hypothetical protein WOLCODRAFT_28009 [Wolfiporia cocos MD-104 SS10]|uniref:Uncharacterized protein n=1 Tax=Wolfiporia cocos (strain MD-104) TaxID=742152 RepID=A0A2H3J750_WOLCO|nr:hypothetical protein WOLCODRAFT_28009 [Wolfiporia cocos MD-104 SS10]
MIRSQTSVGSCSGLLEDGSLPVSVAPGTRPMCLHPGCRTSSAPSALRGPPFSFGASCLASPLVADTFSRAACTAPPASGSLSRSFNLILDLSSVASTLARFVGLSVATGLSTTSYGLMVP